MTDKELMMLAAEAREKAYAPYSDFRVGAALLCKDGKVYCGCNIENAAFTPTVCAERTAFFKAIYDGEREFKKIAIIGGKGTDISEKCYPCGVCRQVMTEFCDRNFGILVGNADDFTELTIEDMLPYSFTKKEFKNQE